MIKNKICWYYVISEYITWDIVKDNFDKPWNYYMLSRNPNITWEIIKNNLDKPWNYEIFINNNPNIMGDKLVNQNFIF